MKRVDTFLSYCEKITSFVATLAAGIRDFSTDRYEVFLCEFLPIFLKEQYFARIFVGENSVVPLLRIIL